MGEHVIKLNKEEIKKIIPHREPMLFVDEVTNMVPGESIVTNLYISPDLDVFRGHFPGDPVLPGVLTVEAMAQTADILLLSLEKYAGKIPYFIGIDEVKFKRKIEPGDKITMEAKISKENKEKAIVTCDAVTYNNGKVAASAKVTLAMR